MIKMFEELALLFNLSKTYWYISFVFIIFCIWFAFRYFILVDDW